MIMGMEQEGAEEDIRLEHERKMYLFEFIYLRVKLE